MPIETTPFDPTEHLESPEAQVELLHDALETTNTGYIVHVLGVIVRARGASKIAEESSLGIDSLCKSLASDANPEFGTIVAVLKALGLRLSVERIDKPAA